MMALTIIDVDDTWECRPNGSAIGRKVIGEIGTRILGEVESILPNAVVKNTSLFRGGGLQSQSFRKL